MEIRISKPDETLQEANQEPFWMNQLAYEFAESGRESNVFEKAYLAYLKRAFMQLTSLLQMLMSQIFWKYETLFFQSHNELLLSTVWGKNMKKNMLLLEGFRKFTRNWVFLQYFQHNMFIYKSALFLMSRPDVKTFGIKE